eukprot:COSAG02_NODE_168_length_31711_cov_68.337973_10_plen_309_part_00
MLQHGFEAGMSAGLSEGRDVGYWVGLTAALQALPAELRKAVSLSEDELPTVNATEARVRRLAKERFDQSNEGTRQRAERFEASDGASETSGAAATLTVIEPGEESQVLASWAPDGVRMQNAAVAQRADRTAQLLILGLPHRVFLHGQPDLSAESAAAGGVAAVPPGGSGLEELIAAVAPSPGRAPRFVSQGCTAASEGFSSHGAWPSSAPPLTPQSLPAEQLLPLLKKARQANPTSAAEIIGDDSKEDMRVHGRVYAVDDNGLAALDALHCNGTRGSIEITLEPGSSDVGGGGTIICQSWTLQQNPPA